MKRYIKRIAAFAIAALFLIGLSDVQAQGKAVNMVGAWQTELDGNEVTLICSDQFFSAAIYSVAGKRFVGTLGGSYRIENDAFVGTYEFNTMNPEQVGESLRSPILDHKKGSLVLEHDGQRHTFKQLDDGTPGKLAGAWLITGRMQRGEMSKLTPGARRTMKILSGTRFQWIAYNVETREFSGTGGGTYTTKDGKYTEHIEFFSRDGSRVGASLSFDFALEDGNWRHKGLSSRGDPIDEVWTKREKIKL